ncbi:hypothetical protein SY88_11955 [Clostridiales bacterium PH28_bin88]|nr:hypothetical protein SY88_11955 [Clostridiales bacterium PH28_bin88]
MTFLGLGMGAAAYLLGFPQAALGVTAGLPVGFLNYWLVASAIQKAPAGDPMRAQAVFMGRAMSRMLIAMVTLGVAALVGVEFVVGVAMALATQMLTYFIDAWQVFRRHQRG